MSQQDDPDVEREQISLSSVYRRLDDQLGSDEAPYDVGAGLERLVGWMNEERPASQAGSSVEHLESGRLDHELELFNLRARVIERTASLRVRSSLVATGTVALLSLLAGLLFGLLLVPVHAAVAVVVTVGIIYALMAFTVGYLHRTTMKSLQGDVELLLKTGAKSRRKRRQAASEGDPKRDPEQVTRALERFTAFVTWVAVGVLLSATVLQLMQPSISIGLPFIGITAIVLLVTLRLVIAIRREGSSKEHHRGGAVRRVLLYALFGVTTRHDERKAPKGRIR